MSSNEYIDYKKHQGTFYNNGSYWFMRLDSDTFVIPACGDIVEYLNGERAIVANVMLSNNMELDVRVLGDPERVLSRRGRSVPIVLLSEDDNVEWPYQDSKLIRDGRVILPISKWFSAKNNVIVFVYKLKEFVYKLKEYLKNYFEKIKK